MNTPVNRTWHAVQPCRVTFSVTLSLLTARTCQLKYSVKGELEFCRSGLFSEGQILVTSFTFGKDDKEMACHLISVGCDSILHS